ncbi:TetR/AcrR family transcriptional regulator [Nocardia goodfellowii]|uniref:AcrR family transcriptional regulator n=1 Tax=Nocardia goodfellowii TaxID=882446 RepID=A0ABS4QET0_9NOCA|nr:TetR/AcrR family transcriptional regulator [Nocardia goodfellowii]MBP2190203.1 AcrR family transcriptional regulator [Nocardia goodfellowii]
MTEAGSNRLERRKARTRAALVAAAQSFLSAGRLNAPILEITQAADVGMGSFYNHFDSREHLFGVAVEEALDRHGAALDLLTVGLDDPARVFTQSFRLTGRFHRLDPTLSKVLLNNWQMLTTSDKGLAPRARRDIAAAAAAGRFEVDDLDLAMTVVAGSSLCLGQLLHDHPDRDAGAATDQVAEQLLRMFGLPTVEAHEVAHCPLPSMEPLILGATAAPRT